MRSFIIFSIIVSVQCASVFGWDGDATWYNLGMTACGETFSDSDLVAAVATSHWVTDPNGNPNLDPICQKSATVIYGGKSVTVRIKDKCGGCKSGDIDLSPAAFQRLDSLDKGRIRVSWNFV